ncbi:MAG: class I SAM-dependent methyltransferase, partial [Gammaproteobacteria bacterium]|nr:class I SAM-dependent methyltransferase [Gammaproteobacteria bacterium]
MNIWQDFLINDGKVINKWRHYFPIYEKHLSPWRNKSINFLEIGVSKGGSLQMWHRFFGPMATIVGIDLDPESKEAEEDGIHVRIGDQGSPEFLQQLIDEFGQFDIIIDDGSHMMEHM